MAEVSLASASERQKWESTYFAEYVRESGYKPYMGTSNNSVIIVKKELQEESGKTINIPLITRLRGTGVTGSQVLEGNEEDLGNYSCALSVDWRRNAVRIPKSTSFKTEIDLWGAAKDMLKSWEAEKLRDDITKAFLSIVPATSTTTPVDYGTITLIAAGSGGGFEITVANQAAGASQANLDSWLVLNQDRVLFGAVRSNYSSGDHSVALATLDTTADKLSAATGSLAKSMAKLADPHIRPFKTKDGREFFVMFCNPRSFRDLKADTTILSANRDARPRDVDMNPIFQDGDLLYDGIIYREVPEIPILTNAGASATTDVGPNFLCGAQALGVAWGQEPQFQTDLQKDFKFRPGVAIEELLRVQKLHFNGVQQGVVTVYTAAAPNS
jgi:N4-gp56 family major capsid protein